MARELMPKIDRNNTTGWRHQHGGVRLHWEDTMNQALPHWRTLLATSQASWLGHCSLFLSNAAQEFALNVEGLVDIEPRPVHTEQQQMRTSILGTTPSLTIRTIPTATWCQSVSIGSDLYSTLDQDSSWQAPDTFELVADSETMVNLLSGRADPGSDNSEALSQTLETIAKILIEGNWGPRNFDSDPVVWRRREYNKEADFLANYAMDTGRDFNWTNATFVGKGSASRITNLQGWSDGGSRPDEGVSSYGWILKGWCGSSGPYIIAVAAKFFDCAADSSLQVEISGMQSLTTSMWKFLNSGDLEFG